MQEEKRHKQEETKANLDYSIKLKMKRKVGLPQLFDSNLKLLHCICITKPSLHTACICSLELTIWIIVIILML